MDNTSSTFTIGFFIGALILTRIVSLVIEVPTGLIMFFAARRKIMLAPVIAAVLTFIGIAVIYAAFPVRDKSLSTGNQPLELAIYAVCVAVWLGIDLLIVYAAKAIFKPKTPPPTKGIILGQKRM